MAWKMHFTLCLSSERLRLGPLSCGRGSPVGFRTLVLRGFFLIHKIFVIGIVFFLFLDVLVQC